MTLMQIPTQCEQHRYSPALLPCPCHPCSTPAAPCTPSLAPSLRPSLRPSAPTHPCRCRCPAAYAVFLWRVGARPRTRVCQFNWVGTGIPVATEVVVGSPTGFRNRGWTGVFWSGPVPDCATAPLKCGTSYRLLVYTSYRNNIYGLASEWRGAAGSFCVCCQVGW